MTDRQTVVAQAKVNSRRLVDEIRRVILASDACLMTIDAALS